MKRAGEWMVASRWLRVAWLHRRSRSRWSRILRTIAGVSSSAVMRSMAQSPSSIAQSADWPPRGAPASSANGAGLNEYRCGQGRLRVAGAIVARPGRCDTRQSPATRRPCGEYRVAGEAEARRQGVRFRRLGGHAGTKRWPARKPRPTIARGEQRRCLPAAMEEDDGVRCAQPAPG